MNKMQVSCGAGEHNCLPAAFAGQNLGSSDSTTNTCVQPKTEVNSEPKSCSDRASIGQQIGHHGQPCLTQRFGKHSRSERMVSRNHEDNTSHPYGTSRSISHPQPPRERICHSAHRAVRLNSSVKMVQKTCAVRVIRLEPAVRVAVQEAASRFVEQISAAQVAERILAARDAKQIPSTYPSFSEAPNYESQNSFLMNTYPESTQSQIIESGCKEEGIVENSHPQNSHRLNSSIPNQVVNIGGTVNQNMQNSTALRPTVQNPSPLNTHSQRVGSGKIYGQNVDAVNQMSSNHNSQLHSSQSLGLLENERKENHHNIQRQLIMILHADHCQLDPYPECCKILQCSTFKGVLSHMANCQVAEACQYPYCSSSKRIYQHWNVCRKASCPICQPLILKLAERRTSPSGA